MGHGADQTSPELLGQVLGNLGYHHRDGAWQQDPTLVAQTEPSQTEDLLSPASLLEQVRAARNHLVTTGTFLVEEALGEGDPGRDIVSHPDYVRAQSGLAAAREALRRYSQLS